ncbi:hypothetical protein AB1Y20_004819 [Prymnesium parvum]|uniref:Uncharacterized protein n=1 Tax=Prymnesium parvum TaxID=97485 RepID=A0AB34IYL3_PRYPA
MTFISQQPGIIASMASLWTQLTVPTFHEALGDSHAQDARDPFDWPELSVNSRHPHLVVQRLLDGVAAALRANHCASPRPPGASTPAVRGEDTRAASVPAAHSERELDQRGARDCAELSGPPSDIDCPVGVIARPLLRPPVYSRGFTANGLPGTMPELSKDGKLRDFEIRRPQPKEELIKRQEFLQRRLRALKESEVMH